MDSSEEKGSCTLDKKRKSTCILICLLLAGSLAVLNLMRGWEAADYTMGYGPSFYPKILIAVLFILLVILFLTEGLPKKRPESQTAPGVSGAAPTDERVFDRQRLKFPAMFAGMLILYILLWNVVGFIMDTILFSFCGMISLKGKPWISAVISVCFALVIYFVFSKLLYVNLPVGMVWGG